MNSAEPQVVEFGKREQLNEQLAAEAVNDDVGEALGILFAFACVIAARMIVPSWRASARCLLRASTLNRISPYL